LPDTKDNTLTAVAETNPVGNISYTWYHTPSTGGVGAIIGTDSTELTLNPNGIDSVTGTYQVKAVNRINNKTARTWSNVVSVPAPETPILGTLTDAVIEDPNNGVKLAVEASKPDHTKNDYTWTGYTPVEVDNDTFDATKHYIKIDDK
jgi:hypothetical protein